MRDLLIAAEKLTARLRVLQRLQMYCRETHQTVIELNVAELFEASDLEAIEDFEAAKATALGQRALPFERVG